MEIEKELKVDENPSWTPTRLWIMQTSPKMYWFNYILRYQDYKIPSNIAMGKHAHTIIDRMWAKDASSGLLLPGFKSQESCMNISRGEWMRNFASTGLSEEKQIEWGQYDGNGYAKWLIERVEQTAGLAYSRSMSEPPRERAEFRIDVEYEGLKLSSRIDELRRGLDGKGIVIRDHKSGAERVDEVFVQRNNQLTLNAMVIYEALQNPGSEVSRIFPEYAGISLDEYLDVLRVEINDVYPRKDKNPKGRSVVYYTKRTEQDFNDAIETIESSNDALRRRDFHPNKGKHCGSCFFRNVCDKYEPTKYHKNDYERDFPLFAGSGVALERSKPRIKNKREQRHWAFRKK